MDKQSLRDYHSLLDIQESARLILEYAAEMDPSLLSQNKMVQDAIIRRFEILGEASARISESCKNQFPTVPWQVMKAMRNLLIHQYDSVDLQILWKTLEQDIPGLLTQISEILQGFDA